MHERGREFLFRFDKYKVASQKAWVDIWGSERFFCNSCLKISCFKRNLLHRV